MHAALYIPHFSAHNIMYLLTRSRMCAKSPQAEKHPQFSTPVFILQKDLRTLVTLFKTFNNWSIYFTDIRGNDHFHTIFLYFIENKKNIKMIMVYSFAGICTKNMFLS